jgi:hypothetical protein
MGHTAKMKIMFFIPSRKLLNSSGNITNWKKKMKFKMPHWIRCDWNMWKSHFTVFGWVTTETCSICGNVKWKEEALNQKTKYTKEDIAKALKWKQRDGYWFEPFASRPTKELPDFQNDLNACFKYVWPEYLKLCIKICERKGRMKDFQSSLAFRLLEFYISGNPASAMCQDFMEMKGGE